MCYLTLTPDEPCAVCQRPAVTTYGDLPVCAADYEALAGPDPEEESEPIPASETTES